jgi:probable HAF family extracellular repeat protein
MAIGSSFTPLGFLPNGYDSTPNGVSANGSVVVGQSNNVAFRWTPTGGMVRLAGTFGSSALGVSADGTTAVGQNPKANGGIDAVRWTAGGGPSSLGILPGGTDAVSYAYGASADGSVIVGRAVRNIYEPFRWTEETGMVGLGGLNGYPSGADALAVSADGSVIVGSSNAPSGVESFRWTEQLGMVSLGHLPGQGGFEVSHAWGVSPDGSFIVGDAHDVDQNTEAFRWTSATGMVGLGDLPGGGTSSIARGVSADGSVVVGRSAGLNGYGNPAGLAFVWTQATGMQSLLDVLVSHGVTGLTGWNLYEATAISPDGRWIIGVGQNPQYLTEAFLVELSPVPLPGAMWLFGAAIGLMGWTRRKPTV